MGFLFISCLSPRISYFYKDPQFLSLENGIRNQDLVVSVLTAIGMLFF